MKTLNSIYLELLKMRDETMKVRGSYSMKRLMVAGLFPLVIWMCIYITVKIPDMAFSVFTAILAFLSVIMGINAVGKKAELKTLENIVNDKESE
jgi:hypothetical protein